MVRSRELRIGAARAGTKKEQEEQALTMEQEVGSRDYKLGVGKRKPKAGRREQETKQ